MLKNRSITTFAVLFVFLLLTASGILTALVLALLVYFRLLSNLPLTRLDLPIAALIVCVLIGTGLGTFLTRRILRPLRELIAATRKIGEGDFSVRVASTASNNEFSELIDSFNTMASELGSMEMFRADFINTFSHEFKTPIVSIRGFARQLKDPAISAEEKNEYIDIILSESERMTNMASNILLLTKFENQSIITEKTEFDLDEQLRDAILLLEKQWTEKELQLELDLPPVRYRSNSEMLSHVWINLLSNAIKFSPHGGTVKVTLAETEEDVSVTVRDGGEGIPKDKIHRIFDKFYQGDTSRSREGNGLGLALVKRIVELCDGYIKVESEHGRGSEFFVSLPKEKKE